MPSRSIFLLDELIGVASGGRPVSLQKLHVGQPSNVKAPTKTEATAPAATVKQSAPPGGAPVAAGRGGGALPATKLLYQADTYLFTAEATVLEVGEKTGGGGWAVVLDETCFHAQGGGQPADTGTLTRAGGGAAWAVRMVKKDGEGVVRHDGEPGGPAPDFGAGDTVSLAVDEPPRRYNARVHSAGHLIDVAMTQAGSTLRPTKGYHFTPGAYVEYEGKLEASEREALLPKLQAAMDELIARAVPSTVQTVDATALGDYCSPNTIPSDPALWGKGWVRVVGVGGMVCPCGGTHVADTRELGAVKVEAVKGKGKVTRISYTVLDG